MTAAAIRSNRPLDFVETLGRAAGWSGDARQIALAASHRGQNFDLHDYTATLRNLELEPVARNIRLSHLSEHDAPCLYRTKSGHMRLVEAITPEGLRILDENAFEADLIKPGRARRLVVNVANQRDAQDTDKDRLRQIIWRQRRSIIVIVLLSILVNLLGLAAPLVVLAVYDTAIPSQSTDLVLSFAILVATLAALELTLRGARAWLIGAAGAKIDEELTGLLFQKLLRLPYLQLIGASLYQQISRLKQFESIREMLTGSVLLTAVDLPFSLIFLIVISVFAPTIGAALLAALLALAVAVLLATKWQISVGAAANSRRAEMDALNDEITTNRRSIRSLALEPEMKRRAFEANTHFERAVMRQKMVQTSVQSFGQAFVALAGVGAVALATLDAMSGAVSFGALILIITLVWRVLSPIQALMSAGPRFVSFATTLKQVQAVLSQEEELRRIGLESRIKRLDAPLSMKNVFLRFDNVSEPALSNVSFTIGQGELVALTGRSASGKTCLLNCFAKFLSPGSGAVAIGGVDYRQLAVEDVRRSVSFATYDNWMFDATLFENLRTGNPELTEEHLLEVFDNIGALKDVKRLRGHLHAEINKAVLARLSIVQLKSFSLARALCRPATVYLLDDAMAGLSPARADEVWAALQRLRGDATIIAVVNRPEQLASADRVLCLDRGRLVVDGAGEPAARSALNFLQG